MNGKQTWRSFIDQPSQRLEEVLYKATGGWGSLCVVCAADMGRGAHDHIQSQNHWKKLWSKLQDRLPLSEQALGLDRPWVQHFDLGPAGKYLFNHLTGEQALQPAQAVVGQTPNATASARPMPVPVAAAAPLASVALAGGTPSAGPSPSPSHLPVPTAPPVAASLVPVPVVQDTLSGVRATSTSIWDEDAAATANLLVQRHLPSGVASAPSAAPTGAPQHLVGPGAVQCALSSSTGCPATAGGTVPQSVRPSNGIAAARGPDAYKMAMLDKQSWRAFMEPPAKQLEDLIYKATGTWNSTCPVCATDMTRGYSDHLPSQNHWKKLWERLNRHVPEPNLAHDWGKQWVQKFELPCGVYLFNHVTGEQGFQDNLPVIASTTAMTAPTKPQIAPLARSTDYREAKVDVANPDTFDLALWVWRQHVTHGAQKLQDALGTRSQVVRCCVCEVDMGNVVAHLTGNNHFQTLHKRAATGVRGQDAALDNGPWVQQFQNGNQDPITFNHITGRCEALEHC